jgi:hypothetical protein
MSEVITECQATVTTPIEMNDEIARDYMKKYAELAQRANEVNAIAEKRIANLKQEIAEYNAEMQFLESSVKSYVLIRGKTLKGDYYDVVFSKGRTTWNSKALEGYALIHPEILACKQTGEPSASLRIVKVNKPIDL